MAASPALQTAVVLKSIPAVLEWSWQAAKLTKRPTRLLRWWSTCTPTQTSGQVRHHGTLPGFAGAGCSDSQQWTVAATGELQELSHSQRQKTSLFRRHSNCFPLESWTSWMNSLNGLCVSHNTSVGVNHLSNAGALHGAAKACRLNTIVLSLSLSLPEF